MHRVAIAEFTVRSGGVVGDQVVGDGDAGLCQLPSLFDAGAIVAEATVKRIDETVSPPPRRFDGDRFSPAHAKTRFANRAAGGLKRGS